MMVTGTAIGVEHGIAPTKGYSLSDVGSCELSLICRQTGLQQ